MWGKFVVSGLRSGGGVNGPSPRLLYFLRSLKMDPGYFLGLCRQYLLPPLVKRQCLFCIWLTLWQGCVVTTLPNNSDSAAPIVVKRVFAVVTPERYCFAAVVLVLCQSWWVLLLCLRQPLLPRQSPAQWQNAILRTRGTATLNMAKYTHLRRLYGCLFNCVLVLVRHRARGSLQVLS